MQASSPMLELAPCNASSPSQSWNVSGADVSVLSAVSNHGPDGEGEWAAVSSCAGGFSHVLSILPGKEGCWEIHGCDTKDGARLDSTSGW